MANVTPFRVRYTSLRCCENNWAIYRLYKYKTDLSLSFSLSMYIVHTHNNRHTCIHTYLSFFLSIHLYPANLHVCVCPAHALKFRWNKGSIHHNYAVRIGAAKAQVTHTPAQFVTFLHAREVPISCRWSQKPISKMTQQFGNLRKLVKTEWVKAHA